MVVPRFLDPDDPKTRKNADGDVVVCYDGSQQVRTDYVFVGACTPDMIPLDEEAEALSEAELRRGQHPMDSLPANGSYADDILAKFTKAIEGLGGVVPNTSLAGVDPQQFAELQDQVRQLMEQNAAMQAQLLEKAEGTEARRR
jgi:hypothetical protein